MSAMSSHKPKGPTARYRAKRRRAEMNARKPIREYVFDREQDICRCCRRRRAESRHELVPLGRGGKVSKKNCVAVCGQLVGTEECCHTYLQQSEIKWSGGPDGAEGLLRFIPTTQRSADWMRVAIEFNVCSMPGGRNEEMPA